MYQYDIEQLYIFRAFAIMQMRPGLFVLTCMQWCDFEVQADDYS